MSVDPASFRQNFPEFQDVNIYPPSAINYWLRIAGLLLPSDIWGELLDVGTELFIAHNLVIEARANADAVNGNPPGVSKGIVSAESVDKVSVSYDTTSGLVTDAGHWNLTVFGTRFIDLVRKVGARPLIVGAGFDGLGGGVSAYGTF